MLITPPPTEKTVALVHIITELYAALYRIGKTLPKRDHFGIHMRMENLSLIMLETAINAQFSHKNRKVIFLEKIRAATEVEKHLVRTAWNLHIVSETDYATFAEMLVEISKMTNGWLEWLYKNGG